MTKQSQHFLHQAIRPAPAKSKLEALIHPELDWDWTVATALEHGVVPLLYWNTKGLNGIPQSAGEILKEGYYATLLWNNRRLNNLRILLDAFDQVSISAIVLKGAMLAVVFYPDVGLRPFSDIDILVERSQIEDAGMILEKLGYKMGRRNLRRRTLNYGKHMKYVKGNTVIELHWSLCSPSDKHRVVVPELFETAQQTDMGMTLSPDKMLLHFCLHLHHHGYFPLIRFCDVAHLLNRYGKSIDWKRLIVQAKRWRITLPLACVMRRLNDLWGYDIPELSELLVEKKRSTDLMSAIISRFSDSEQFGKLSAILNFDYCNPRSVFDKIFQRQENVARRHPQASSSLWMFGYYLARPFVLIYKILKLLLLLLKTLL